jgi:hypothetical protein
MLVADAFEERERELEPHRVEEQNRARMEVVDRLRDRGIPVAPADDDIEIADLLDAVERFEAVVEAQGGDLFVTRIGSAEPQNTSFVLPEREPGESASDYRARVIEATRVLRRGDRAD